MWKTGCRYECRGQTWWHLWECMLMYARSKSGGLNMEDKICRLKPTRRSAGKSLRSFWPQEICEGYHTHTHTHTHTIQTHMELILLWIINVEFLKTVHTALLQAMKANSGHVLPSSKYGTQAWSNKKQSRCALYLKWKDNFVWGTDWKIFIVYL